MAPTRLALSQITRGGRAWPRRQLDQARVALFRELLVEDPEALPPLIVIDDRNGGYLLADGHHRAQAHEELGGGYDRVHAEVRLAPDGRAPEDYAYELALELSAKSSVPLARAERRAAVLRLLEERRELSDRQIARLTGVSHQTVGRLRDSGGPMDQPSVVGAGATSPGNGRPSTGASDRLVVAARRMLRREQAQYPVEEQLFDSLAFAVDGDFDQAAELAEQMANAWTAVYHRLAA